MNRPHRLAAILENGGFVRRRTIRLPTLRGWSILLAAFAIVTFAAIRAIQPFLAVTDRVSAEMLVIEGWNPDFALRTGLEEFRRGGYRTLICTGGPVQFGEPLSRYGNYAEIGRATLATMGAPQPALFAVPAPHVEKDRTYTAAVALRRWLHRPGAPPAPSSITVLTTGAHARRTRLMFAHAFGGEAKIGIISVPEQNFDGRHWWRSSGGVRSVLDESIAYVYARFFFSAAGGQKEP